jgi:UbiD family decarboxylase
LRDFIKKELAIKKEVTTEYEIAKLLHGNQDKTVFFERVKGYDFRVVGNVCYSRERLCEALNVSKEEYIPHVLKALENPVDPIIMEEGECQTIVKKSLDDLPILRHFEKERRYITSGIVIAKDPKVGRNVSVHRMMVLSNNKLAIRLVERHLYEYHKRAEDQGKALEVAIVIGVHPAIFFASSYSVPLGYDEFRFASSLLGKPLELVKCKTVELEVPRQAEIIIEGRILPRQRAEEGPFVDITGTYDIIRKQPIVEVTCITHRKQAIYHALLPSGREHKIFMGMPQEPKIYDAVKKVANVKNACLTEGGCNWLHGVVSIAKKRDGEGKEAILAALEAHRSMKHVVVVDEDIDIFDPEAVEYAIATRFQADRDMVVIRNVKGSSLDPSASKDATTTKVGIDATKPLGKEKAFEVAEIP